MKNFDLSDLVKAHKTSSTHRKLLSESTKCGCFYCLSIFDYEQINEWIDFDDTALCPTCGIDSVIGGASGFPITQEFLKAMQQYYFQFN
ncbi:cytoplasmic protein [Acinetobacter wuhouensis]|uniref:Cytoplasmic protein n=2 Tax=Acinetobacter wuhouensis TaxID=1879050 RepID=A0A4Q7AQ93_9GAMM|nr:cytoplasmic protein [Acinetobacter wuhouensis]RZG74981.1 cytoplasmic protein [Acinetobacter wuhouensis]